MSSMTILSADFGIAGVLNSRRTLPCPAACRCGAEPRPTTLGGAPPC